MTSFGETLKFFRKQQGMTQKQLAAKIGVHVNTIWAWERGDYLPQTKGFILEIANQLGLSDFETRQLLEASLQGPQRRERLHQLLTQQILPSDLEKSSL